MALSFSAAASARASCQKRRLTLRTTIIAITVPARASPVRKDIADKVVRRITSGLRVVFQKTDEPALLALLCNLIRTRHPGALLGFTIG